MAKTMPQGRDRRRWWRLWIYPRFQGMLIVANVFLMGIVFALVAALTYRSYTRLLQQGTLLGLPAGHPYFQFLQIQFTTFLTHLGVAFIAGTVLTSTATLLLSHRLAGPIVRLKGFFGQIAGNGLGPSSAVTFRTGDFFAELPEIINRALAKIVEQERAKKRDSAVS
jgi:hypothetical protein